MAECWMPESEALAHENAMADRIIGIGSGDLPMWIISKHFGAKWGLAVFSEAVRDKARDMLKKGSPCLLHVVKARGSDTHYVQSVEAL